MKLTLLQQPDAEFVQFLSDRISEFNWQHWEVSERKDIGVSVTDEQQQVIAGASGRTFGHWLLLERLWVSQQCRGQQLGSKILEAIENGARERGCRQVLLDTLNFQAMPFYQKHGYQVQWIQENYPETGCKYFMVKDL